MRFFCSEEHAPVRFSTVAPFCCRTTPASTVQHGPVRFYSDSSTAHVRFYRSTESTPPRALARQCRFTILYTVAPRSADVQDGSGTAAKEGGGRFRAKATPPFFINSGQGRGGHFGDLGRKIFIFTPRWNRLGITETVLK